MSERKTDTLKKILAVDDELHMRQFLVVLFKTAGYEVKAVRDGKQGMASVREDRPDLIVLDVMMPGEGGVPMYQQLKTNHEFENIPVVMLSGVDAASFSHSLKLMNAAAGVNLPEPEEYMEKPPQPELLLETVQRILGA